MARIEEDTYLELVKGLSPQYLSILESFYEFAPTYSQYNINRLPSEEEVSAISRYFQPLRRHSSRVPLRLPSAHRPDLDIHSLL